MEQLLPLLPVELAGLPLEEVFHLGQHAVRVHPAPRRHPFDPRRRVAPGALGAEDDAPQLLLAPGREEGRALHRPDPGPDPDGAQIGGHRFRHREVGRVRREVTAVEAVRIAGLGEQLLGPLRVVGVRVDGQGELHVPGHDVAGQARGAEGFGLVDRLAVDGEAGGKPQAPVVPRRLRVPLLGEVQEEDRVRPHGHESQTGRAPHVLGDGAVEEVGDVDLAALEGGGARRLVRDAFQDQALDARHLAPVALEGFEHQLDPRRDADEPVGAGPDGGLLEALLADLLDVLPGDDPAGAGRGGAVEGHEIGPRLLELEPDAAGVDDLHLLDAVLEQLRASTLVALEGKLHVVRGDRVAVVELHAAPHDELVGETIRRHRPRLGEARGGETPGHGLHHRVVDRIENHEGRDGRLGLGRIEPPRGQGHVDGPAHLPFGGGPRPGRKPGQDHDEERRDDDAERSGRLHHGTESSSWINRSGSWLARTPDGW